MAPRKRQDQKTTGAPNTIDLAMAAGLTLMTDATTSHVDDFLPSMLPSLDYILAGGLAYGRVTEVYGLNQAGKSVLATHFMKMAISFDTVVVVIDVENTTDITNLTQLGVDPSKVFIVTPAEGDILTIEGVTEQIRTICTTFGEANVPVLIIWDSLASTSTEQQLKENFNANQMGKQLCPLYK